MHKEAYKNLKITPSLLHEKPVEHYSKGDIRYWRKRIAKRSTGASYDHQFCYKGRRVRFNLETTNRDVAASKIREIHQYLVAMGWVETLAKYKPELHKNQLSYTLGEYIQAVEELSTQNPRTVFIYIGKARTIVAEMRGIKKTKSIANPQGEAHRKWREKVYGTPLEAITGPALQQWKRKRKGKGRRP
ncbi:MAG: hypothetical protein OSB19_15805 [Opitutaceae bacterium]|nr:hypothetical protein [Opitutaceae bacterium]